MAVTSFTGIQGAGKTYHAIYRIWQEELWKKYYVVHNIDGVNPELMDEKAVEWVKSVGELGGVEGRWMEWEWIEGISTAVRQKYNRPTLFICDEAWKYLRRADEKLERTLSEHRHLKIDIWLIYPNDYQLHKNYIGLIQSQWRADNPYLTLPGRFQYKRIVAGEKTGRKVIKVNKAVYKMYRSWADGEGGKLEKSRMAMWAGVLVALTVCALVYFVGWGLPSVWSANAKPARVRAVTDTAAVVVQTKKEESRLASGLEGKTLAACMGGKVLVQGADGGLRDVGVYVGDYALLRCDRERALVETSGGRRWIHKQAGIVKVAAMPAAHEQERAGIADAERQGK